MKRLLQPILNKLVEYEICYGNRFLMSNKDGFNIRSSGFKVAGISETVYMTDIPNSNGLTGSISLFTYQNSKINFVRSNVGMVDYEKGEIRLSAINIVSTVIKSSIPIIEISAVPVSSDVYGINELFLQLDVNKSSVEMIDENLSSSLPKISRDIVI